MEFANPWMLFGLVFAGLPVAVHLLGRRRAPVVAFAALAFILATNPKQARALRVSEWLLVAVRTLAVALIVLALAKPMLPISGSADGSVAGDGPVALVLVIDDSMSTFAEAGGEPVFEAARARAVRLVERLPQGSQVSAVASGFPARVLLPQLTQDRSAVLDELARLEHRPRRDDADRALQLADRLLGAAGLADRRVIVMTDLQDSGWRNVDAPWHARPGSGPSVTLRVEKLEPGTRENTAIVDASAAPASERGPGQARVDVELVHYGRRAFRDYLTIRTGDREVKSLVHLQPGERVRRSYFVPATAGTATLHLPPDGLDTDNRRTLRLDGGSALRVALVNGAPRPNPRDDEVFFAARALELAAARPGEFAVDVLQLAGLGAEALRDYDVIVLANPGELPATLLTALQAAVDAGKGLLATVGDNLPADAAAWLPGLLPARLHGQHAASAAEPNLAPGGRRTNGGVGLRHLDGALPAVPGPAAGPTARLRATLAAVLGDTLHAAAVQRYALVMPSDAVRAAEVLRFSDGAPALLVAPRGRGHVGAWLTTLDRDWTDLPLQPTFLPLLHETVVALAGDRGLERRGAVEVGELAVLARDARADMLEVRWEGDTRGTVRLTLPAASQRGHGWQVAGLDEPGRYTVTELRGGAPLSSRTVIAVPPSTESDLAALGRSPLQDTARARPGPPARPRAPAWGAALLILLALLMFEGVLLARGTAHVRIGRGAGALADAG